MFYNKTYSIHLICFALAVYMAYRILIVDDQRDVSRLLRSALETIEQGLEVREAPSGEEAILEASRNKFDLLIADYRLPGITGAELIQKFRVRNPDIKVMMITGVSDPRIQAEIGKLNVDAFFAKPVQMADFLDAVERVLGMARTILGTSAAPPPAKEEERKRTMGDVLVELRQSMDAQAVTLLNGQGHVEAEAGDLQLDSSGKASLISALMGIQSASQKVAGLIGRAEHHLHLFDSDRLDGVLMPLGAGHLLLVIGKGVADLNRISTVLEAVGGARDEILGMMEKLGLVEPAPAPVAVPAAEAPAPALPAAAPTPTAQRSATMETPTIPLEFDMLLRKASTEKKAVDANSFWDNLVEQGTKYTQPDKLTYEQAVQLGLAPKGSE